MKQNRYIVLLKDQHKSSIQSVEREFSVSVTSSELLSKDNRSYNIIDNKNAVLYKNLGVVVVDDMDEQQLTLSVKDTKSPVIWFEKERDFFAADEITLINELKTAVDQLKTKITELENFILHKPIPQQPVIEWQWGLKAIGMDKTGYRS